MRFPRTIKSLWVTSPICLAVVISGCKSEEKSTAWEEALDTSDDNQDDEEDEDENDDKTEDAGMDDETTSTSTDTTRTSSAGSNTATTSTQGNSGASSAPDSGASSSSSGDDSDEDSSEGVEDSTSGGDTPEPDAGGDTVDDETTSSPGGCDGYLLCETFEDVDVGDIPEGWNRRGENVAVSADDAHGGERALKIDAANPGPRQIVRDASVLGAAHWGRVYYRVELPVPDAFVHMTLVAFSGDATESGPSEFRVVNMNKQAADTPNVGSKHNWAYNVQVTGGSEWVCESNYDREFDADWHCAEYFVDANEQTFELYVDGQPVTLGGDCNRWELPMVFDELRVGWNYYAEAPPGFTAYVDDIAFDDEPIGCD